MREQVEDATVRRRITAVFHVPTLSGPAKTLAPRLRFLAEQHDVEVVAPSAGPLLLDLYADPIRRTILDYDAATMPDGVAAVARTARRVAHELRTFRPTSR